MKCPFCATQNRDRVLETRTQQDGSAIRRRRECEECGRRFTTLEQIEEMQFYVVKSDGRREPFDRSKIVRGMQVACTGRRISLETLEQVGEEIERKLYNRLEKEISTESVGELVMEELQKLDHVAYVRFASVYRHFEDITQFREIVNSLRTQIQKPQQGENV